MYRLNPLHRNVLITTDEVIVKAPIEQDIDVRNLQNAIEIAEERFIVPALGNKMYEDFIDRKNVVVITGNKTALETSVNIGNTGESIVLINGQIINAIDLVTNAWYIKLWNRYLWKITAECVAYIAITTNAVKSAAQGEIQNNPAGPMGATGAAAVGISLLKFKMDKTLMERIDPLMEAMRGWLCANKSEGDLSLWDSSSCPECLDGKSTHRKMTGWVHGIYDPIKNNCECD